MKTLTILLLTTLLLSSCSHYRWLEKNKDKICATYCVYPTDTLRITEKDTIVTFVAEYGVNADSALMSIIFECDSNNQVLITKVDSLTGIRTTIKYVFLNNTLHLTANTDSIDGKITVSKHLLGLWKTIYCNRQVPTVVKEGKMIWWGWLLIGALLMLNVFQFFRK